MYFRAKDGYVNPNQSASNWNLRSPQGPRLPQMQQPGKHVASVLCWVQGMMGSLVKRVFSRQMGVAPANIFHCTIMPCYDRKLEAAREDLRLPGLLYIACQKFWVSDLKLSSYLEALLTARPARQCHQDGKIRTANHMAFVTVWVLG